VTETFKHRKQDLVSEGFSPEASGDAVFVRLPGRECYTPLDTPLHEKILACAIRF
jgi:fatty-acyl-CoA synthase